jgi:SAM-dependent methyltransferase
VSHPFGVGYADAYDALYADKDYEAECDLITGLQRRFEVTGDRVVDLGCGTGRHAVLLAQRGMRVTGVDLSPEMLAIARERAREAGVSDLELHLGDVRDVRLETRFDIALLMFAVLGYQSTDEDVARTIMTARRLLRPGGLLIFDVWNGLAVEAIGPSARAKTVRRYGATITRWASATLDAANHRCAVEYEVEWVGDGQPARRFQERHEMRYFFEGELRDRCRAADLRIVASGAFPGIDAPADASQWNALYAAIATD